MTFPSKLIAIAVLAVFSGAFVYAVNEAVGETVEQIGQHQEGK